MRFLILQVLSVIMVAAAPIDDNDSFVEVITCEEVDNALWSYIGDQKTCFLSKSSVISSESATIAGRKDESITSLTFDGNKNIFFLPKKVDSRFPGLIGYDADGCSFTAISRRNFAGLKKLRVLFMSDNMIEKVSSDTFDDLVSLEYLYLRNNRIKSMNSAVFQQLTKLVDVSLNGNQCIDEHFDDPTEIAHMRQTVTENCRFDEDGEKLLKEVLREMGGQKRVAAENSVETNKILSKIDLMQTIMSDMVHKTSENAHLKLKVTQYEAKIEKQEKEAAELKGDLLSQKTRISDDEQKIKKLKEKIQILSNED